MAVLYSPTRSVWWEWQDKWLGMTVYQVESAVVELGVVPLGGCVAAPNPVQRAVVLWSFQMSAYSSRVSGVVEGGWEPTEDPFAPIIHHLFHKATIIAPLLW